MEWASAWFDNEVLAAQTALNVEPRYAVSAYAGAGNAAREIFGWIGELDNNTWAMQWYDAYRMFLLKYKGGSSGNPANTRREVEDHITYLQRAINR